MSFGGSYPGTEIPPQGREESGPEITVMCIQTKPEIGTGIQLPLSHDKLLMQGCLEEGSDCPCCHIHLGESHVEAHSRQLFCQEGDLCFVFG